MSTALKLTTGDKISSTKAIDSLARFARRGAVLFYRTSVYTIACHNGTYLDTKSSSSF